jgi:pimeloyl-ACP methyl ester carboxylesterase
VLESGIAEPLKLILQRVEPRQLNTTPDLLRTESDRVLNQRQKLAAFRGRTLVMHTRNDDIVPFSHGIQLHDWAGKPKNLIIFERGDHNNIMEVNEEKYFEHLGFFISNISVV